MAKREHLLDKDIETFFNDQNWDATLNKRIINWKTHINSQGPGLFSMILDHHTNNNMSLKKIMEKLESGGYQFSSRDYFPYSCVHGDLSISEAKQYIKRYNALKDKGIILNQAEKDSLAQSFSFTFSKELYDFFKTENIEPSWEIITKCAYSLGIGSADFFSSTNIMQMKELASLFSEIKQKSNNTVDFYNDMATENNISTQKIKFIMEYVSNHNITNQQQDELFQNISPPQHRLEQYMYNKDPNFNIIEMLDTYRKTSPKLREWFTPYQIDLIESLEKHFNVSYLEKNSTVSKNKLK